MIRLIFGCGYLGFRVAQKWHLAGDDVYCVTRSQARADELKTLGMSPIIADITQPATLLSLPQADTVLFAVGMDRSRYDDIRTVYVDGLQQVVDRLPDTIGQLIYISSTGVYGDFGGQWINEDSPTVPSREGGKACLEAERRLSQGRFGERTTVLRFAGIYGPDRVPTKHIIQSGQWKKLTAQGYLNLIHVDDGAQIIEHISNAHALAATLNVSDGNPPIRKDYYQFIAQHFGIAQIPWDLSEVTPENSRAGSNKRVSNQKLIETFNVEFAYRDYQTGLAQALGNS